MGISNLLSQFVDTVHFNLVFDYLWLLLNPLYEVLER